MTRKKRPGSCKVTAAQRVSRKIRATKTRQSKTIYFDSYDDLKEYIADLKAPRPGYIRVFRGQCKDYGSIRPTGVRIPMRNARIWQSYCWMLAADMLVRQGTPVEQALKRAELYSYWFYAIAQHYGPGTHLLDVSHSVEVSLWFALHRATVNRDFFRIFFRTARRAAPYPSVSREDDWVSYMPWEDGPGTLYIFDVPRWSGSPRPKHGELVDLADSPDFFARSSRISAQHACLIASDPEDQAGDLTRFLAHPPIQVGWPMNGSETVTARVSTLFPSPEDDEWYARLLFLPMVYRINREQPHWRLAHPMPISLYNEHLQFLQHAISFNPLQPPLLFPWLIAPALRVQPPEDAHFDRGVSFLRSAPILLEAPIFATQPDHDHEDWDHAALTRNLPGILPVLDWESGEIANEPVLLNNVLFELSPLESVGWLDLLRPGVQLQTPRAVHLVREDALLWRLQVYYQLMPEEQMGTLFEHPIAIRFDLCSREFQCQDTTSWVPISTNYIAAKSLLVGLSLLQALSPRGDAKLPMGESIRTAAAVLHRTADLAAGIHYYVMRDVSTGEPYCPARRPRV